MRAHFAQRRSVRLVECAVAQPRRAGNLRLGGRPPRATEHLNICRECTANGYVRQALAAGYRLVALDSKGRDDLTRIAGARLEKILLVIGGEHHGVGQYILNQAHHVAGIPQRGKTSSLNASVAAGIALFILGG